MKHSKDTLEKFRRLGITSCSELSLITPFLYEDLRLSQKLQPHSMQLIDATVESVYRAPNSIQITFFAHNFSHQVMGVMFRPRPYMLHQFVVGERNYYYGMIECKVGTCSMSMPKKITNIGAITPKYKSALRSDVMLRFMQKTLTLENLLAENLREEVASELVKLHFPQSVAPNLKELDEKALSALKYTELFVYMRELANKRRYYPSLSLTCSSYSEWTQTLPFTLTDEQLSAIEDIKTDFKKGYAARRIIVGDVGSGKTMVILASAVMNSPNRSILMVPTTILANQIYEEAKKYLPMMRVALFTSKNKNLLLDDYDFIVGTHALLYRELPKTTLVMVDEQHRFGTAQRNLLEKMISSEEESGKATDKKAADTKPADAKPHFLQFSATPIPRTQAMIETAHIDVSLITSTPFRRDIDSRVIHKSDFSELLEHIKGEIVLGNQVLLVYPLVEQSEVLEYQSIEEARGFWENRFENVYVTHGKDKEKEEVLKEFDEKGSILIATTVVEVGISLSRLSTVVIVGAERLGLSTLHQLRGRVSRTGLKGYCFLYTNQSKSERLDRFIDTTSGFDIANLDLKYRKGGDLLRGHNQSGSQFKWVDLAEDEEIVKMVKDDLTNITLNLEV